MNEKDLRDQAELEKYLKILVNFVNHRMSAPEFEDQFLKIWRADNYLFTGRFSEQINIVLSTLMSDVDQYCSIVEIRDENDLDDNQLLECARLALEKLTSL